MARIKKAPLDMGKQNIDNYELPSVNPEFVDAQEAVIIEPVIEAPAIVDLEVLINDCIGSYAPGTTEYELSYVLERFNLDRESRKAELIYRLACLAAGAPAGVSEKIATLQLLVK